jgi:peptidyl-prolyl cis-trans isomerase SurA
MPLVFCVFAVAVLCTLSPAATPEKLDGVIAVVGDEVILQSEVDAYTALRMQALNIKIDSGGADVPKYRKKFLDEIIDGKVLIAHAKNDTTVAVTNDEVDNALDNHIQSILQQNRISIDSLEVLLQREQGMTLAKFKSEAKNAIREQLLKQKVQRQYLSSVRVSRRDVEAFYAQYRDSLPKAGESVLLSRLAIEVSAPLSVRQAAWEKILSIKQRLAGGADFAALAKRFSEGSEAAEGGDLGFISKGSLSLLALEEKAFSLPVGQTSDPFETPLGFHIVTVVAKQEQKVHIRQIFVKVAPAPDQVKKTGALLDSIRTSSASRNDFIAAVRRNSTDKASKPRDGRVGWKALLDLPPELRSAIDTLGKGAITPVVAENKDLCLYRIDERVSERILTLNDDWQILAEKAKDIQAQKKLIDLVQRWRKQVYISIRM